MHLPLRCTPRYEHPRATAFCLAVTMLHAVRRMPAAPAALPHARAAHAPAAALPLLPAATARADTFTGYMPAHPTAASRTLLLPHLCRAVSMLSPGAALRSHASRMAHLACTAHSRAL